MAEPPPPAPPKSTFQRDIQYLQQVINTQQAHIDWAAQEVHRSKLLVHNSIQPLNERSCRNKDCKAMQERLERTSRSIIDLVNHSLQPN